MPAESPDPTGHTVSCVLRGPAHGALGERVVRAVGGAAALGLSAGRYPKALPALDANEDAVAVLAGPSATVAAVADGHIGADAACAAVDAVSQHARGLSGDGGAAAGRRLVDALAGAAADAVQHARRSAAGERRDTATALSLVVVAGRTAWTVTFGDTAVVRVRGGRARLISRAGPFLLDGTVTPKPRRERLRSGDHVVAVSDGVTDHLGRGWSGEVARRVATRPAPADVVDSVLLGALDGAAGDHLSCAVVRCG